MSEHGGDFVVISVHLQFCSKLAGYYQIIVLQLFNPVVWFHCGAIEFITEFGSWEFVSEDSAQHFSSISSLLLMFHTSCG